MEKQTACRENLGELAPKFAELNDDVLFGEGEPNVNYAQYFVGNSYLKPLTNINLC